MPTLRIIDGFGAGFACDIEGERITIGRDAANQVQIGDPKASRTHAEVVLEEGAWLLRDLNSSNGTWNDQGAIDVEPLDHGTTFRIGRTYMRFEKVTGEGKGTMVDSDGNWETPANVQTLASESALLTRRKAAVAAAGEELARSNEYLALLHQVVLRSNEAGNREELFEVLDDVAADALEGDRCAVFLPTPDSWTLWPPHERRLRARFGATPFARSLLKSARARREPLLCTFGGDLDPSSSMMQAGTQSAMVAPLRIGEDVHALLYVDRISGGAEFTRTDLEFLAAVGNQLAVRLHNFSQVASLEAEVERLSTEPRTASVELTIVGHDASMDQVRSFIERAAPTPSPVLIGGESGTGKELVARAIHEQSKRLDRPLQTVNCAAMAENLVEATLFGHVKGAFTGADQDRPGLFELADQGTLFLDEVGELPIGVQAKLLRVLEQGEVQRLGENVTRTVDVRLIAATNRDLEEEAEAGGFRKDLLHRLDVLQVILPPLRERPGDIDLLIDHFLQVSAKKLDQSPRTLTPDARTLLLRYHWPGNIRQLRNTIERACVMSTADIIRTDDLPEAVCGEGDVQAFKTPIVSLAEVEKMHILRVLEHTGNNKKAAAELLGIDRSTLYAKLRQYGVH